jgi:sporulation protein YlmC with PRC-barrel domain
MEEGMLARHLKLALLGTALIAAPALAQTNPPASTTAPATSSTTTATTTAPASGSMGAANWMTQPQQGQWRSSKLEGLDVYNQNNEKIGDIDEMILDNSGKIQAVVIGVGGFLGIGERNVAVPFDQIKFVNEPRAAVSVNNTNAPATPAAPGTTTTATNNANAPATTGTATTTRTDNANRDVPDHAILMVNMTKDQLKEAPEFKYNR